MTQPSLPPRSVLRLSACLCALLLAACAREGEKPKPSPVPVVTATATRQDVPIRIEAVGTVEAIASVAVKSRIDGQIVKVALRDGADVARGQVLFEIDPRPAAAQLKQAEAKLAGDLAQAEHAREQDRRYQDLLQKHFVSPDAYNQIKANLDSAEAAVEADRAAVDSARLQLEYTTLRAPIAGRAGRVQIQIGNMVKANDTMPLLTINQLSPIYVNFAVPESALAPVRAALRAGAAAVAIKARGDNGQDIAAAGSLSFVDNAVDTTTGTVRLRATLANRDTVLWPGQFVTASLTLGTRKNVVVVPADAVQNGPNGTYVYLVDSAGKAQMRPVAIGATTDGLSVVSEGLQGGEQIVTDGQSRLLPGALVAVQPPAAAK